MLKIKLDRRGFATDLEKQLKGTERQIAEYITKAMQDTAVTMKQEARGQLLDAGLSQRLANTWRSNTYPTRRNSLNPATYLWSNAPEIINSMSEAATIKPGPGRRYLAIPTDECPRIGRGGKRMTPHQVERAFNQDLIFLRTDRGRLGAFVRVVKSKSRKRLRNHWRAPTQRRLASGRDLELVMMFTMVPTIRTRKIVDIPAILAAGEAAFPGHLQDNWR